MSEKHHSETAGEYRTYRKQRGPGKGDAPRNISSRFKKNFDDINWKGQKSSAKVERKGAKTVFRY